MAEETKDATKFNMAIATLQRMDRLLLMSSEYAMAENYVKWADILYTLRREIIPFIKETEKKTINNLFKELYSFKWLIRNLNGQLRIPPILIPKVAEILDRIATEVNIAMNNAGILMPKSTEGGWD